MQSTKQYCDVHECQNEYGREFTILTKGTALNDPLSLSVLMVWSHSQALQVVFLNIIQHGQK